MAGPDEVEKGWAEAWSMVWPDEWPEREWMDERQHGNQVYTLWKRRGECENETEYGYTTEIIMDGERVPQEVAIFGRRVTSYTDKEDRRKMRWMKRRNAAPEGRCQA